MGLDIYFHKIRTQKVQEGVESEVDEKRVSSCLGYFRKVNFLVGFFESFTEDGIEDCEDFIINQSMVIELINRCKTILDVYQNPEDEIPEAVASDLLPTTPGFFFGSYEYDEYYYNDVKDVLDFCENTLLPEFDKLEEDEEITFFMWY